MKRHRALAASICAAAVLFGAAPRAAQAHCDTLDGPVVVDARAALDAGRSHVAAHVDFIHCVEGLHEALASSHHGTGPAAPAVHQH